MPFAEGFDPDVESFADFPAGGVDTCLGVVF